MTPNQESFYLFESDSKSKVTATSALAATCLVVQIKSTEISVGGYGYYRIDFKDYTTGTYLDLLRNHDYRIEVESIEGLPAGTPDEAYKGNHTLKCKIVPWNQVQEDVKVPAVKRLSVDTRSIRLIGASAMTTGKTLTVTTENTGGWQIDPSTVPSWLTVSPMSGTADGTGSITVKSNSSAFFNTGSFKLKAGNAEMAIYVKLGKLPLEYVAEFNLAGGSQYGAKPNTPSLVTSAQTDAALRFANSHNNDQSGYYNWYVCKGEVYTYYNPGGKNLFSDPFFTTGAGKGYHLPSRQELTGVFSYTGQANYSSSPGIVVTVNEACQFGNIKKTFGADYYSGNGTCYALRFKQGTGAPTGDTNSSLTNFPLATDNSMLCAYRYRCVGSLGGGNTDRLEIDCVHLGSSFTGDIHTISNDSWWSSQPSANIVTRIFPAAGYIYPAAVSGSGTLHGRGGYGVYWSGTEYDSSSAWAVELQPVLRGARAIGAARATGLRCACFPRNSKTAHFRLVGLICLLTAKRSKKTISGKRSASIPTTNHYPDN
ncbi:BACON domain-containing protein [Bacteroides sp. 260]|uniref:BACON domain-containing protein n=1 Tax=Bacteroides sp. 260 TaxID=3157347 RepID=UPI0040643881